MFNINKNQKKYFNILKILIIMFLTALISWFIASKLLHYFIQEKTESSELLTQNQSQNKKLNAWQILEENYTNNNLNNLNDTANLAGLKLINKPYADINADVNINMEDGNDSQRLNSLIVKNITPKPKPKPWLIINFWGSWCPPCVRELPMLNDFFLKNQKKNNEITTNTNTNTNADENPPLLLLGISFEDPEKIRKFLAEQLQNQQLQIAFPLLNSQRTTVLEKLSTQSYFPLSLLINPEGQIIARHVGEMNLATLNDWQLKIDGTKN